MRKAFRQRSASIDGADIQSGRIVQILYNQKSIKTSHQIKLSKTNEQSEKETADLKVSNTSSDEEPTNTTLSTEQTNEVSDNTKQDTSKVKNEDQRMQQQKAIIVTI